MAQPFLSFLSPAKLNLGLKVVGKRSDGYHLLKSVFCLIDVCDKVDIQPTTTSKISLVEHGQAWFYQKDLAYRAACLLQQHTNTNYGANLRIKKVIPSGAGMGGGSSNAATVLLILNQLWQTNLSQAELEQIGLSLGADIPFFIRGKNALVSGIGEIIEPITLPQYYFVIVKPKFHAPTKEIFNHLNLDSAQLNANQLDVNELITTRKNDLEAAFRNLYPEADQIFQELSSYAPPALTGSGSSIYLTFTDKNLAKNVANRLRSSYNTFLAASLAESPVACN